MVANDHRRDEPPIPLVHIPPEWMRRDDAVALLAELYGADPALIVRGVTFAAIEGAIPIKPDFDVYRAADPTDHVFQISADDDLSTYTLEPSEIDWSAFMGRVYHHGTVRSMDMPVLLERAATLRWASTAPLMRRALSPAPAVDPCPSTPPQMVPPAPSPSALSATPKARVAAASEWMTKNVTKPGQWKRDAAIASCMAGTACRREAARIAWSLLPCKLRGRQGRPQKQ